MGYNKFLDQKWLNCHLQDIKNKAGSRYTPKLNVDLPISEIFDGLGRTQNFYTSIKTHLGKLNRAFRSISGQYENKEIQKLYNTFRKELLLLIKQQDQLKEYDTNNIPWRYIKYRSVKVRELMWKLSDKLREEKDKLEHEKKDQEKNNGRSASERLSSNIHYIYEVQREINFFDDLSSSVKAKLSNKPYLLLNGIAGTGKTHLLCDVVENRINNQLVLPSILIFGEFFTPRIEPWKQILNQLGLKISEKEFLTKLNSAGKKSNTRAFIIIDALNETGDHSYWKRNLVKVIEAIKKYPNVGLIVSIRSGFEKEVLSAKDVKKFINEQHQGFQFREWEAVSKFFKEFCLPFPEIPLLMPEFQNPLFLLLFCKAFQERSKKKNKQIFRGHEGATYIFEAFVDSVAKRITKKFNITGSCANIWDTIIEKIAEEMIGHNNDRISETELINIVSKNYPSIDQMAFTKDLESNLLIIKVPRYSQDNNSFNGFDYRFPFQKFSDHLLGRYLFKKYEKEFGKNNKNLVTAKKFFSKRRKLGKYLSNSWNRGLVEAISIQCPEHLKGCELIDVAPYLKNLSVAQEAFVESLIWRRPNAFSVDLTNTKDYINNFVIRSESGHNNLLNAFLAIAPIPNHPFNADFLYRHLMRFTMAERDSWWSTFLHRQHSGKEAVDRIVEWAWSEQDKSHINDESLRLFAIALGWFLTTPNRFLRDKSTKALVALLTNKLSIVLALLKQFKSVNDPYVIERLYAVAYGCTLRTEENPTELKNLALWVYKVIFKNGKPPIDILIRDYARGIIEVALHQQISLNIDRTKIVPPFNSTFPIIIPSEKTLKKKYYPESFFNDKTKDRGYLDIWSSVMYNFGSLADFGNYVLNSAVNHWSGRRLNQNDPNRKMLYETYKRSLTKQQKTLLERATNRFYGISVANLFKNIRVVSSDKEKLDEEKIKKEEAKQKQEMGNIMVEFETTLQKNKKQYFQIEIKPYLDDRGSINDPLDRFNTGLAQRWLFNRVVKLGWNSKLHGQFDGSVDYNRADRSDHKPERIGKKYQWIALYELLARISDNYEFKEESWSSNIAKYKGPWQLSVRDIDPSCILKEYPNLKPDGVPNFVNHQSVIVYNAWDKKVTDLTWLKRNKDLPDPKGIIELIDDEGISWLALEGFVEWQKETPPEQEKYDLPTRTLWYMVKSYLVKKQNTEKVHEWAKKQDFMGRWMPESHEFYNIYLGEFPWAPSFLYQYVPYYNHDEWTDGTRNKKIPAKVLVTDDEYLSSGSSVDCSTNESIRVKLAAKWIIDEMKLYQDKIDGRFFDRCGNLIAFDPCVYDECIPRCLLIRKDKFCEFIKNQGYSIVWTLLGEKNLIGGKETEQSQRGRLEMSGAYTLDNHLNIEGSTKNKFVKFS